MLSFVPTFWGGAVSVLVALILVDRILIASKRYWRGPAIAAAPASSRLTSRDGSYILTEPEPVRRSSESVGERAMSELSERLKGLEITVSEGKDGRYTAFTSAEPLFCFVRENQEELEELINATLSSYVSTFLKKAVQVSTVEVERKKAIPVHSVRPVKSLVPRLPELIAA
jgi:hypothetical protein